MRVVLLLMLTLTLAASGCTFTQSCTAIGCGDALTLEMRPAGGGFPDGAYTLTLETRAGLRTCRFVMPDSVPQLGALGSVDCDPGASAWVEQATDCTETRSGNATSESCRPVPGRFALHAQLQDTPDVVSVRVERDGLALLDSTLTPTYETSQPNGPDCGPVCHQATEMLELP
jgi:hypothetical protein